MDTWSRLADAAGRGSTLAGHVDESSQRLHDRDAAFFGDRMPAGEAWRLYADFHDEAVFLDIETTGLGGEAYTTVCGALDRDGFHAFVRGVDLDDLPAYLEQFRLIVTFNGRAFDVPFLRREFGPGLLTHAAHFDLMHVLRRLGLRGGLKRIERALGVGRPSQLSTLDGRDAVHLWNMDQEGDLDALPTLVRYNAEDVAVLPRLAEIAVRDHAAGTPMAQCLVPRFSEPDLSALPFDASLVYHLASIRGKAPAVAL